MLKIFYGLMKFWVRDVFVIEICFIAYGSSLDVGNKFKVNENLIVKKFLLGF